MESGTVKGFFSSLLGLAFMFIIANGIAALAFVIQLREAHERMDRALQSISVLKEVEDPVQDSSRDQRSERSHRC